VVGAFAERFGDEPAVVASAPGRVNLIGEHTDYNDGWVLPLALPQRTVVHLRPRPDASVRVASGAFPDQLATYAVGRETRRSEWVDYVQGTTVVLRGAGMPVGGFDAFVSSQVPVGAGLSSSAALTVALLRALRHAFALALDDRALAQLAQRVETDFIGARIGIMDQMVVSLAEADEALLLDCRTLDTTLVALPPTIELVVIDSGIRHAHAGGPYNERREECVVAARTLGVPALRDVTLAMADRVDQLPALLRRRVQHVLSENVRVHEVVAALRARDGSAVGRSCSASHISLRDDYEVSVVAVDRLVAFCEQDPDCFGARMTGGGFGGSVVAVARCGAGAALGARVCERFGVGGRVVAVVGA
jgi:galactokinase